MEAIGCARPTADLHGSAAGRAAAPITRAGYMKVALFWGLSIRRDQ